MDVLAGGEGGGEARVPGQVGDGPQLHLVVVGHQQAPPGGRHEGLAEPSALLGAHRDVVQVGPVRRQPAGAGHRLAEGGVDPTVGGHLGGQALPVGGPELLHLAVAQQGLHDRVLVAQQLEGPGVGREPGLGLAHRSEAQRVVEHRAELGDRVHLERGAGQVLDGRLQGGALLGQPGGDRPQDVPVDGDADDLHAGQHPDQRLFDVGVEGVLPHRGQGVGQRGAQPGQDGGQADRPEVVLGQAVVGPGRVGRLVEREGPLSLAAGAVVDGDAEEPRRQIADPVPVDGRDPAGRRPPRCPWPGR